MAQKLARSGFSPASHGNQLIFNHIIQVFPKHKTRYLLEIWKESPSFDRKPSKWIYPKALWWEPQQDDHWEITLQSYV